jgi:hypothetical protein
MSDTGTNDTELSIAEQIAAAVAAIGTTGDSGQKYNPPTRYKPSPGGSFPALKYDGPNLLDSAGNEQPIYDTSEEYAKFVYGNLTPSARQLAFTVLKDKGFYGGGEIGDFSSDINAIQGWLDYSNTVGYTTDRSLKQMLFSLPSSKSSGGNYRPRINVSSPEDLKVVAKKVSMDTLGRAFTEAEADKFVKSYQAQEIGSQQSSGGGVSVDIPSVDVAAQEFSQELAPTEANAYKYLGYVDKFFNSIGGVS